MASQARPNLSMGSQSALNRRSTRPIGCRANLAATLLPTLVSSQQPPCGPEGDTPSGWKQWLNAWLTTSSAITLACQCAGQGATNRRHPPAASYTGCIFQRRQRCGRDIGTSDVATNPTRHRSLDRFVPQENPCETISIKPDWPKNEPTRPICGSASGISMRRRQWPVRSLGPPTTMSFSSRDRSLAVAEQRCRRTESPMSSSMVNFIAIIVRRLRCDERVAHC